MRVEADLDLCQGHAMCELEEMVRRWLESNRRCEELGDWRPLAELYTEDATYGWNVGPGQDFMAVGRDEIRELALGAEMGGLDGWSYPYQSILLNEREGAVAGFWQQVAAARRPDGSPYEVAGIGGSWFRYGGRLPLEPAARLVRPGQRHGGVRRDVEGRGAVGGDAAAAGPGGVRRAGARLLPSGADSRAPVVSPI
ncbi:hypothetical protein [Nonomuraea sp. MG754425]|uniref:hypothetical protein n=1 Tax=Nonomuraea sp. MG754425 TaxID=2570319 RepID=UPI001F2CB32E|nr:hypothetical protein [Nonomuraea sp. MG754425]